MSEEQKENNTCSCKMTLIVAVVALLLSLAAVTLSIIAVNGGVTTGTNGESESKVVISKQYDKGKSFEKAQATAEEIKDFDL